MSRLDLPKSQKKIARRIIETGLQREYAEGLNKIKKIIDKWEKKELNNRDAYLKMYKTLESHDRALGRRYDNMGGSKYVMIIAAQVYDGVIGEDELEDFIPEVKNTILFLSRER